MHRVYGPTEEDYSANMQMLRYSQQKILDAKIFVLNPNYVKANAKENAVGRGSWLGSFSYNSTFVADGGNVSNNGGCVRGVRREVSAAGAQAQKVVVPCAVSVPQEVIEVNLAEHYKAILSNPEKAIKSLDDNTAAGLLKLTSEYYSQKK